MLVCVLYASPKGSRCRKIYIALFFMVLDPKKNKHKIFWSALYIMCSSMALSGSIQYVLGYNYQTMRGNAFLFLPNWQNILFNI